MALTVIKPTGIDTSGNYTVNGMNVSANASVANLTVTTSLNLLTNSANLGPVGNVIITGGTSGYVLQTDGAGNLSWQAPASGSSISNGNSNVSIPTANGNINFTAVGNTVMVITGTGANIAGTANVSGNLTAGNANLGNLVTANYFTGTLTTNAQPNITSVGTLTSLTVTGNVTGGNLVTAGKVYSSDFINGGTGIYLSAGPSGYINFFTTGGDKASISDTGNIIASNLIANSTVFATTANISANVTAGNANLGNLVTANYLTGTLTTAAQPNITSVGTLTDLSVSGNGVFGGNLTVNGTLTYINSTTLSISDPIINLQTGPNGAAPVANTGKDVGTALNYFDTSAKIAWMGWDVSNAEIAFGSNVGISSEVVTFTSLANIRSGNAQLGNNVSANFFTGNGIYLTGITTAGISNGNSNVNIPSSNGNVNISAVGNANILVVTGTGANITGTLNVTGNATVGNIVTSGSGGNVSNVNVISANTFIASGNLTAGNINTTGSGGNIGNANVISANTFTASGNITSANANLGNSVVANYFTGNFYGTANSATTAGTVTTNAQPNITSVGTLTSLAVTGNITSGNANLGNLVTANFFTGNGSLLTGITTSAGNSIVNGNSNVVVAANANVTISSAGNANIVIVTGTGANINGYANITGNLIAGNITAGAGSGGSITGGNLLSANYITGTLTTNAQPNITSVGTLSSLSVTGNITAGNANLGNAATANYFIGNFYGTANSATTAATVTTNAQPNITSIGSLTGLTVSNATGVVNFTTTANVTLGAVANLHIAGGSNGQYLQTDGSGTLTWSTVVSGSTSNISNGNSNVNIPSANGNINFSAVGNANVVVITGTGANISGTANVTGNLVAGNITAGAGAGGSITGGNLVSANYFTGTLTTNAQPNVTSVGTLTTLSVTGNGAFGNVNAGNLLTANYSTAVITTAAQPNITSVGTLTSLDVSGTVTAAAFTANTGVFTGNGNGLSSIVGANVTGQVGNALVSSTVYTNAQPNITSIGSLTGLTVSNATGVVNFTTTANVTLGAVANLHIAGGTNAYVLSTDGTGNLSWVAQSGGGSSNISNGNSNVNIPTSNGNINFSAVGNANVVVVTGTGANINGTLNVTGQSNLGAVGNIVITGGTANYVLNTDGSGNLSWIAPPGVNSANVTVDNFTGNGVQTIFTLSTTPIGINQTSVNYNGATVLRTDYTLANANITFSSAPANGSYIEVTTINLISGSGGTALTIQDEGSNLTTTASLINFVGNGIAATNVGNSVTVTVNTSGGLTAQDLLSPFLLMGA